MPNRFETLRARFSKASPPSRTDIREEFEQYFTADETVKYGLAPSKLVHEHDEDTDSGPVSDEGKPLIVVTDQKILGAVGSPDDEWVGAVPYTDVRSVDVEDGLLRSTLTVDVWADGTYRAEGSDSDSFARAATYMREATHCWHYTLKKRQAATERMPELSDHLEAGRLGEVRETRETIRKKLDDARLTLEEADIEPIPVLLDRLDETRRELHRTEIYARLTRATTLLTRAGHLADSGAYTDAYQRYWDARDLLENARMLARQADIEEPAVIEGHLDEIEIHLENLRILPLALAKQAHERAEKTETLDVRIEAFEEAFEHYRDALTAGWGTNYEFAGDTEYIRFQIEWVVANLVTGHYELAEQYIERGNEYRDGGDIMGAWQSYEQATEHVEEGKQLAREFRTSNPDEFADLEAHLASCL